MNIVKSYWYRMQVWYESLDCQDNEYFGYEHDATVLLRPMTAKALERRLVGEPVRRGCSLTSVDVNSFTDETVAAGESNPGVDSVPLLAAPGTVRPAPVLVTRPSDVANYHLPFALPDQIAIEESVPAPRVVCQTSAPSPVRQWVGIALAAIAVNAMAQFFTVSPLEAKVERLSSALSGTQSTVDKLLEQTRNLQRLNAELSAELAQLRDATDDDTIAKDVPNPYMAIPLTQWMRDLPVQSVSPPPVELE